MNNASKGLRTVPPFYGGCAPGKSLYRVKGNRPILQLELIQRTIVVQLSRILSVLCFLCLPFNLLFAQWSPVTGSDGYGLRNVFRGSDDALYAWSSYRLFRSIDGAQFWREMPMSGFPMDSPVNGPILWVVRQHPYQADCIVAATNVHEVGIVLRSRDGGSIWQQISTLGGCNAADVAAIDDNCHYINCGRVSINYQCGVALEANEGIHQDYRNHFREIYTRRDGSALLYCTPGTIYSTVSHGRPWKQAIGGVEGETILQLYAEEDTAWIVTEKHGVWRSRDLGNSWAAVNAGLGPPNTPSMFTQKIARDPRGPLVVLTRGGIFASVNGGDNWQYAADVLPDVSDVRDFAVTKAGQYLMRIGKDSIMVSEAAGTIWKNKDTGLNLGRINELYFIGDCVYALGAECLYRGVAPFTTASAKWRQCIEGLPNRIVVALTQLPDSTLITFDQDGAVSAKLHSGNSWIQIGNGIPGETIRCSVASANGAIYAGAETGYLFRSTDRGLRWEKIDLLAGGVPITSILPISDNLLLCGTHGAGLYASEDSGTTWKKQSDGLDHQFITALAVCPDRDIFAGSFGGGIFRSTDLGKTWMSAGPESPAKYITSIVVNQANIVAVATIGSGILVSKNKGATWLPLNSGLTDLKIARLVSNEKNHLFIATQEGNVWQNRYDMPTGIREPVHPQSLFVDEPVPHPFRETATFNFTTDEAGRISLVLYDLFGREIRTIFEGGVDAGQHSAALSTGALPSGPYYLLIRNGKTQAGRIVLHLH